MMMMMMMMMMMIGIKALKNSFSGLRDAQIYIKNNIKMKFTNQSHG
jgi:hypothetical protein